MAEVHTEFSKFVDFYGSECDRTGFKPNETTTRDQRIAFLQSVVKRYCHPYWAMKRADPGRPISDEAVVWCKHSIDENGQDNYRWFGDFIVSGGSSGWHLSDHMEGFLPVAQPLVNPQDLSHLVEPLATGKVPTTPGCSGPPPDPTPEPEPPGHQCPPTFPYPDENTTGKEFQKRVKQAYTDANRPFPDPNDQDAFRHFMRYGYSCRSMPEPEAANKHIAELRAQLGLPN